MSTKAKVKKENQTSNGKSTLPAVVTFVTLTDANRKLFADKVSALQKEVGNFKITNPETRSKASEFLSRVKNGFNWLESKRKELVTPFNAEVSKINSDFKTITEPLSKLESIIKNELSRDFKEQEAKRIEAERKAREEEAKKLAKLEKDLNSKNELIKAAAESRADAIMTQTEVAIEQSAPVSKIFTSSGTTTFRKVWKWEVEDIDKVPKAYFTLNEKSINASVKHGLREIPGIRIYEDVQPAGRGVN